MKKIVITAICILCIITTTVLYAQTQTNSNRVLIVYFSQQSSGLADATTSASRVAVDGNYIGHVQHIANIIQRATGGTLFEIQTVQAYPFEHRQLLDVARQEQRENVRPGLSARIPNIQNYDTIFLGYPNWWADMPMPVYTFLDEYNLSGKTVIPFCLNGGSGISGTVDKIIRLQPQANVVRDALVFNRNNLARADSDITAWLRRIGVVR